MRTEGQFPAQMEDKFLSWEGFESSRKATQLPSESQGDGECGASLWLQEKMLI